jgi:hypothetical protein
VAKFIQLLDDYRRLVIKRATRYRCGKCYANPGDRCRTINGNACKPHASRFYAARAATKLSEVQP